MDKKQKDRLGRLLGRVEDAATSGDKDRIKAARAALREFAEELAGGKPASK